MFIKVGPAQKLTVSPRLSGARFLSLPLQPFLLNFHIHSYNGCLGSGDKGRRRSRLALSRRPHANGVKPDVMHHISTPLVSKASSLSQQNRGAGPVLPAQAPLEQGSPLYLTHCLSGCQKNGADWRAFAGCTVLHSLQSISLTTRPHSFDRNDQYHFRGSQTQRGDVTVTQQWQRKKPSGYNSSSAVSSSVTLGQFLLLSELQFPQP